MIDLPWIYVHTSLLFTEAAQIWDCHQSTNLLHATCKGVLLSAARF